MVLTNLATFVTLRVKTPGLLTLFLEMDSYISCVDLSSQEYTVRNVCFWSRYSMDVLARCDHWEVHSDHVGRGDITQPKRDGFQRSLKIGTN